ncbi:hypothetical protein [Thiocapsa sp.]|uniref:hypothetical protein n=1 Tax=Thiocapsa sp. TaxID=2024551 RepID=UPI00359421F0
MLLFGSLMLARHVRELLPIMKFSVIATTFTAMLLFNMSIGDGPPVTSTASILYSDGSVVTGVSAAETNLWGRVLRTYGLHPAYDSVRVPEALVTHLRLSTKAVRVLVSQPRDAIFLPDGSPTNGDGITLEVLATGQDGQILAQRLENITRAEILEHRWIELVLAAPSAISEISIKVTPGPTGSSPNYDSTLLAIQLGGIRSILFVVGKVILSGLTAFILALSGVGLLALSTASRNPRHCRLPIGLAWSPLIFATFLLAIVYWSASRTHFIYYWDYRNYWGKTEQIFELITSGSWSTLAETVLKSFPEDYTMLPAVPTAFFATLIGYPSQLIYTLSISLIYAIPAYLIVAHVADKLFIDAGETARERATLRLASVSAVFFGLPLYVGVSLNLMPDIGGVIITLAAMLLAYHLSRTIGRDIEPTNPWCLPPGLVRASIGLGVLFSAMFLFRRWYVFSAVGIVLAGLLTLIYDLLRNRHNHFAVIKATTAAVTLIATATLSLLSWVLFDWTSRLEDHEYAALYTAYARPIAVDLDNFLRQFGIVVPALSILLLILSLFLKFDRRLLFFVVVPSVVGALLFLQVQSPSLQHYYLLMPLLGVGVAGISLILGRSRGPLWGYTFAGVLLFGALGSTVDSPYRAQFSRTFPSLDSWLPKQQVGLKGLEALGYWLVSPDIKSSSFCVLASSTILNQSITSELWQIMPSLDKHELSRRLVVLGEVDSRDGAPSRGLAQCEIVLVGSPPQTHLGIENQRSVVLPAQDLISGKGIGVAYERFPVTFLLDKQTEVMVFRRMRPLEEAEYQDLVKRYHEASLRCVPLGLRDCGSKSAG